MAGVNIDNVGLTFQKYLDGVVETLNHQSKARSLVRKNDTWRGAQLEGRVHVGRSTSIGYVEDGGAFPVADKQDYVTYTVGRKFSVGSIQLTDGVMASAAKSPQVARDVITSEVKGMMNNMLKFENGMFFRNGDGSVATITGGTLSGAADIEVDDSRMLWDGGTYQLYDTALGTNRGDNKVSKVESSVTTSGDAKVDFAANLSSGASTTDKFVWNGSLNRAISGLDKLINDSAVSFQGVAVGTYPRYASHALDNGSTLRDLTPSLFRQMLAGIKQKSGSDRPSDGLTVLCDSWQAINVEELYEGELRLTPQTKTAGLTVASFQSALGRIDIMVDTDALRGTMFFADFSKIYRGINKPLGWRREGGSIFKRSDTAGVWTATALEIAELYIKERHTSGRINDLNDNRSTAY